jgi:Zn-dependent protease with chaperone function
MSAPASHLLAGVLLDASLKATAILALGFLADGLAAGGSAAAKHAQWAVLLLALPLLGPAAYVAHGTGLAVEASWLGGFWAVGVGVALIHRVGGRLWLEALVRRGAEVDGLVVARAGDLAGPVTFGWWRPRVVVPADWERWSEADREAALAHERAHVRRGDWAVQTAASLVCALFWFHPLVWWAHARLVTAAEHAADDQVLLAGVKPSAYARALLAFSQHRAAPAGLSASRSTEPRIRAVLNPGPRSTRRWPTAAALAACLLGLVPLLGAVPIGSPAPPPTCGP